MTLSLWVVSSAWVRVPDRTKPDTNVVTNSKLNTLDEINNDLLCLVLSLVLLGMTVYSPYTVDYFLAVPFLVQYFIQLICIKMAPRVATNQV